jgi:hypothetical protein
MRHVTRVAIIAAFSLMTALVWSPAALRAQDDTPHPAHVHDGTCEALGDVVAPLTDLSFEGGNATDGNGTEGNASEGNASLGNVTDGNASNATGGNATNATGGNATGGGDPIPAEVSVTTVPLTLDEMLATPHAINVHLSADEIGTYIACGDIGGPALPDGSLAIGLHELNGSGFFGIASLTPSTSSEGGTEISVFLAQNLIGTGGTTGVGGNATDGNATGGNASDANATGGNVTEGNATEGNETEGNATEGNGTEGNETAGNATNGNATGGNTTDGNASNGTDGNTTDGNGTGDDDGGGNGSGGNGSDGDDAGGNDSGGNGS